MHARRKVYISRNYKKLDCGGSIARTDIETVMDRLGYLNIGLPRTVRHNGIYHGVRNLFTHLKALCSIRRGDIVVLQYPMKIMFRAICRRARRVGARTVCLIHDLSAFREKTLTPEQEIALLNGCDVLLTHNHRMRRWLTENGCTTRMIDYEIMDYIHGESAPPVADPGPSGWSLFYVGDLSPATYGYIYELARIMPHRDIYLYGGRADASLLAQLPNLHYEGFAKDTGLMRRHKGDFGLSWYGTSLDSGVGKIGEYMQYNNPHKVSLYMRCNAPVVVWSEAGRADFVRRNGIGICVSSLRDLDKELDAVTPERYAAMLSNVAEVNAGLRQGDYLRRALDEAVAYLEAKS